MLDHLRLSSIFAHLAPVLLLPLVGACGESASAPAAVHPIKPVMAAPIAFADGQDRRTFSAQIKPRVEGSHGFRVAGRVVRRFVDVGTLVKAGDPLAELDDADFHLQLDQAEAEERAARNVLSHEEAEQSRFATLRDKGFTAAAAFEGREPPPTRREGAGLMRAERAGSGSPGMLCAMPPSLPRMTASSLPSGSSPVRSSMSAHRPSSSPSQARSRPRSRFRRRWSGFARTGVGTVSLWSAGSKTYAAHLRELRRSPIPTTRTFTARYTIVAPDESVRLGLSGHPHPFRHAPAPAPCPLVGVLIRGPVPPFGRSIAPTAPTLQPVAIAKFEGQTALLGGGVSDGDLVVTLGVHKLDPASRSGQIEHFPLRRRVMRKFNLSALAVRTPL